MSNARSREPEMASTIGCTVSVNQIVVLRVYHSARSPVSFHLDVIFRVLSIQVRRNEVHSSIAYMQVHERLSNQASDSHPMCGTITGHRI